MINPAVNKNIDTPNSRAAMAQDKNIVSIINKTNKAIEARGGDIKNPASQAIVNRAIMLYRQGGVKNIVTADGSMVRKQYHDGGVAGHVHDVNNPDPDATSGLSAGAAEGFTAEDILKAGVGTQPGFLEYDINGDGKITSVDALAKKQAEAAEAAEKERLADMADKTLEGQRQLIVDINTDPTKVVEKATVAKINKNAVGTTVDESVGKITTPIDLAGTKGEYVQPVETIEPVLTGERKAKALNEFSQTIYQAVADKTYDEKYDLVAPFGEITAEDGVAAQRFQSGLPVDQAVTDKMNVLLEGARGTVTTPGYYKEGGPKGIATATDVEKPDDITASKVTTKTATGDIRSSLTGGERDYVTVPLENVKFDPMVFPGGEIPAELQAQLAPTEEEQVKINEVSARFDPQIADANTSVTNFIISDPPTEEETTELKRLQGVVADLEEQKKVNSDKILEVTFHNPTTGEKITVDRDTAVLSNPPEGFVKGEPEGKFKDGSLESAQGTVSEKAKVTAAQGDAKNITGAGLDKIAQLGTNIFDADGNVIVDKNGEPIKGNFTQIDALDETTKRKLQTEDIYDAEGNLVSKKETLDETGFTDAEQKDVDDTIAKTKAAQIDTGATDKYDAEGNLIRKGDRGYTVQAQLEGLMEDFEGGNTPSWAAGAMRQATATLAARGLGASSMAGQAIVQAAMEAALPIAQADAATIAQFERDNLSNRQQVTVLASQQRAEFLKVEFDQKFQAKVLNAAKISEIANLNFTADQQITLENARLAQTANITNMNAKNAKTMADAAAMATMDLKNLDNKQQAAVQNAKTFLEMDLKNLDNRQEAAMFKAQSITSAILSDAAAENASRQFNASSENQTNQFMANLKTSVDLANAAQKNAISMANAAATNTLDTFNAGMKEARAVLENQNGVTIAQSNAVWRQNAETLDTAAQNQANMEAASGANALTTKAVDQIWQQERDIMDYAHRESEGLQDRNLQILLGDKTLEQYQAIADAEEDAAKAKLVVDIIFDD